MAFSAALSARGENSPLPASPARPVAAETQRHAAPRTAGTAQQLTTDTDLSRAASRLLEQARPVEGAAVAVDVETGRILVWAEIRKSGPPGSVITTAKAPAASVFKVVTTATLFELGGVDPNDRVCISGGIRLIERRHLDSPRDERRTCGPFWQALGHSRNAVYAQLSTRRLTRADLLEIAGRFGFNKSVPFDWEVPVGELSVPYNDLEFARTAAGFRGSTLSPLGALHLATVIARGGLSTRLHLFEPSPSEQGLATVPDESNRILSKLTARRMTRMMEVTVHSGTCRSVFNDERGHSLLPGIRVAGKTGTLRPGSRAETTSWFIGFAPSQKPEIAVSVMLENGPVWRKRAAEIARDLLRYYFHRKGAAHVEDPLLVASSTQD